MFHGHENKVVSICWLDDDTGLISIGRDSKIAYWKLSDSKPKTDDSHLRKQFAMQSSMSADMTEEEK